MLEIGKRAPVFTLPDHNGDRVRLTELKGQWVVLYFYPRDDTPGCTTEAREFSAETSAFARLDAIVLGCSPDPAEKHCGFIARHNLKLRLLSDPEHKAMRKYGAWGEKRLYGRVTEGVIRSTTLIDPTGKVACHWPSVRAAGHAAKVLAKLRALSE